jgi:hypothetical protein
VKQCSKCKIKKKNSEFAFHVGSKDKLQAYCKPCKTVYNTDYRATKEGYIKQTLLSSKARAKNKKVNFNLDIKYLHSIATDKCPVFNVDLKYASSQKGAGYADTHAAALDRVIPELGYVKGNVVFISNWANSIKSDATEVQLYAVADWLHEKRKEVLNAFKNELTPLPEGHHREGEVYPELGPISTAGSREDYYDLDHYQRTVCGQDTDYRTQTRGGDSVGHGSQKVGAPIPVTRIEDHGQPDAKIISLELRRADLFNKP